MSEMPPIPELPVTRTPAPPLAANLMPNPPICTNWFTYQDADTGKNFMASDWQGLALGRTYQIQVSEDLKNWSVVGTETWPLDDPTAYFRIVREMKPEGREFIRLGMMA